MYNTFIAQGNNPGDFGRTINVDTLENLIYNDLFPKIKLVHNVAVDIRNIFTPFMEIVPSAGQLIEEQLYNYSAC
jgi:hypothetical protein